MDFDPTDYSLTLDEAQDMVNHPPHYNTSGIECIEATQPALGEDGFISYCQGNAMKYLWRFKYKGKAVDDLKKSKWYISKIVEVLGKDE